MALEEELKDELDAFSLNFKGKSESVHSASGSFSGSGRKQKKKIKSLKSSTLEKGDSDFFNLTQESQIEMRGSGIE